MAKVIIGFKGVKYKTGSVEGYRPQLEAASKVADLQLAEEVCINAGLSMSPTELNHALRVTLESVPQFVANDGRVREFSNLLTWNRTASGKLDGPGSPWNDTCSAKVKVQLKKDSKQVIDANFRNILDLPTPKLNNVTYPGAQTATNVLKVGEQIIAYGRNMQMGETDGARLIPAYPDTPKMLTCISSDVAHAVFAWPEGYAPEDGTSVTFEMISSGGIEGGGATVNSKKVIVLNDNVTIAQTEDGLVKIYTCADADGGKYNTQLNLGKLWTLTGIGFHGEDEAGVKWRITGGYLNVQGHESTFIQPLVVNGTKLTIDGPAVPGEEPPAGTYTTGVSIIITASDAAAGMTENLTIPITKLVIP